LTSERGEWQAPAISAALGFVTVLSLAWVDGGFFADAWPRATAGLGAAASIALLLRTRIAITPAAIATVAAFGALAALVRLSALWANDAALAALEAERALIYVAGALAAAVIVARPTVPSLLAGVLGAATALCAYSVVAGERPGGSLQGPVGYANALGILAAIGILLAAGLAGTVQRPLVRAVLAAAVVPLVWALVLTDSRGSAVALVAGFAVALALTSRKRLLLAGAGALVLAAVVLAATQPGANRLLGGDRPDYWRVAVQQFEERPLAGSGAGAFHGYWLEHRPDPSTLDTPDVLDAHSLYLETLAELGIVGLALVVTALGIPVVVGLRARRDPAVAVALPAYAAFVVHAGLDWDWELPAVTLTGIFCGIAVVVAARGRAVRPLPRQGQAALLLVALGLVVVGLVRLI
jgi:O-antigen ligase